MVIFKREVTMVNAKERAQAVMRAVEAGLSVEIIRTARHHSDAGFWGDLVVPVITKQK
jgi:hypothetical protein